jgi:NAD(P)-dependent dehydrogenase (short-subunit alcohol dehydrogenase family)
MHKLFDLSGKVAVVTGGSRGIGAMIARGFVTAGVRTYITSRRAEELQRHGGAGGVRRMYQPCPRISRPNTGV